MSSSLRFLLLGCTLLVLASLLAGGLSPPAAVHGADEPPLPPGAVKRLAIKFSEPDPKREPWVYAVAFAPDGKLLAARCEGNTINFWDLPQAKQHQPFRIPPKERGDGGSPLVFAPVGRTLAYRHGTERGFWLWDMTSDREPIKVGQTNPTAFGCQLTFSPDGQVVASPGSGGIRLWSAKDGQEVGLLDFQAGFKGKSYADEGWIAFSPDGRTLAAGGEDGATLQGTLRLWDWRSGKVLLHMPLQEKERGPRCLAYSPDGKALASCAGYTWNPDVTIWDVVAGFPVHRLKGREDKTCCVAFSPDGRMVASAGGEGKGIRVWNPFTGEQVAKLVGHTNAVNCVAFSPDGKLLASGGADGTVILWDATKLAPVQPLAPSAEELGRWWAQLGRTDAAAWQAVWALIRSGDKAIGFLKERLKPAAAPDPRRVKRLLADLDADTFAVREAATRELAQFGSLVEPALRQALAGAPSGEAKRRLEGLLSELAGFVTDAAELQQLRGVQVLEQVGTPAAKEVLQVLAKGAPGVRRTQDAQLALDRLPRRSPDLR